MFGSYAEIRCCLKCIELGNISHVYAITINIQTKRKIRTKVDKLMINPTTASGEEGGVGQDEPFPQFQQD